jgi:hypothetical protein
MTQRLVDFLRKAEKEDWAVDWATEVLPKITHKTAMEKGEYGQLPLHWAAESQAPLEVVDALLKVYPEGAREKSGWNGQLPLHLAARYKAPLEVVDALLKAYPEGAREKGEDGQLPLHLAAGNKAPAEASEERREPPALRPSGASRQPSRCGRWRT